MSITEERINGCIVLSNGVILDEGELYAPVDMFENIDVRQYNRWFEKMVQICKIINNKTYKLLSPKSKSTTTVLFSGDVWAIIKSYAGVFDYNINYNCNKNHYLRALNALYYTEFSTIEKMDKILRMTNNNNDKKLKDIYYRRILFCNVLPSVNKKQFYDTLQEIFPRNK